MHMVYECCFLAPQIAEIIRTCCSGIFSVSTALRSVLAEVESPLHPVGNQELEDRTPHVSSRPLEFPLIAMTPLNLSDYECTS